MRRFVSARIRWTLLLTAIACLSSASVVQAQDGLDDLLGLRESLGDCFRGHPLPTCKAFWIGELGYGFLLDPELGRSSQQLTVELGGMVNLNQRSAVGGTVYFGKDVWLRGTRSGLKARYRHWLSSDVSLEASPGILLFDEQALEGTGPGFTGHIAVNLGDFFAVTGSLDAFSGREIWTLGGKIGSYAGGAAIALAVALMAMASSAQ